LAKRNYQFEKRQKELAKQKKREEKRKRKQERKHPAGEDEARESPGEEVKNQ
jgi:hypothetical protein